MNRQQFLRRSLFTGTAFGLGTAYSFGRSFDPETPLDKALVEEFVRVGHNDMSKVAELLEEHPTLINVAHDWRNGDFETALGAASHVGYKELAQFLLDQGAQANIFTAALFGKVDIVRAMIEAFPATLHAKGPHGFTLLHHASKGGDDALEVKEYLESLGATEMRIDMF